MPNYDPLYLFLCHLEWQNRGVLWAYTELLAALSDGDPAIQSLAESLIQRCSQRPKCSSAEDQDSRIEPEVGRKEQSGPTVDGS